MSVFAQISELPYALEANAVYTRDIIHILNVEPILGILCQCTKFLYVVLVLLILINCIYCVIG